MFFTTAKDSTLICGRNDNDNEKDFIKHKDSL